MTNILLSIGRKEDKQALLPFVESTFQNKSVTFFATENTHKFLKEKKIDSTLVYKVSQLGKYPNISDLLSKKMFTMIINIPSRESGANSELTDGEIIRKAGADAGIIPITDIDVAEIILSKLGRVSSKHEKQWFYDPTKSYKENYDKGPFGPFADRRVYLQTGKPTYNFLGQKVYLPFGIPAGPLLNSKYIKGAFEKGFDICVYKTVRTGLFPCHPFPNILALHPKGDLTLDKLQKPLDADTNYSSPLSITNSFGVPSKDPTIWQEDAKLALSYQKPGQVMILSFMGTVRQNQTEKQFIDDYILAAKLSLETGAKILEVNLSCPNVGNAGLVCYNLEVTKKVAAGIRRVIGSTPLILKVGYYEDEQQLQKFAEIADEYANSVQAINTLQATIVNLKGDQALPGKSRLRSGVCGSGIKWAGLDMVKRLKKTKDKKGYKFSIEGVGGVIKPEDYFEYKKAGADSVMSATGAMWNPYLAQEIKKQIK